MAYQSIALKWRPQSFNDLVGQESISSTLMNALSSGRTPQALLFTGPRGTGKTSSARIYAKILKCTNVKDSQACHKCDDCLGVSDGSHVDILEIDGASNNGVDAIRELRDNVSYMPSSGKYKVYIIDEVHMLSSSAFNALLKTLEEPPEHVVFVLATTEVHKIPKTILSRCQRYDFRRIALKKISERIEEILKAEKVKFETEALWLVAKQGQGSMRDALSLLEQVLSYCGGEITVDKVVESLGLTQRELLVHLLQSLVGQDKALLLDNLNKLFYSGVEPRVFVQEFLEEIRNLLMIKVSGESLAGSSDGLVDLPQSEVKELSELSKKMSESDIHMMFDMCLKGANDLARSQTPSLVLEVLLLRLFHAPRIESLLASNVATQTSVKKNTNLSQEPIQKPIQAPKRASAIDQLKQVQAKKDNSAASMPPMPEAPMPVAEVGPAPMPSFPHEEIKENAKWGDLVKKVAKLNSAMGAKLEHTFVASQDGKKIVISSPQEFLHTQIEKEEFKRKLSNYLFTFWNKRLEVDVVVGEEVEDADLTPMQVSVEKKKLADEEIKNKIENHPLVKEAKKYFSVKNMQIKE